VGNGVLRHVERARQIDLQDLPPLIRIDVPNGCGGAGDAGIVDEDVDAAKPLRRLGDHRLDLAALANVAKASLEAFNSEAVEFNASALISQT